MITISKTHKNTLIVHIGGNITQGAPLNLDISVWRGNGDNNNVLTAEVDSKLMVLNYPKQAELPDGEYFLRFKFVRGGDAAQEFRAIDNCKVVKGESGRGETYITLPWVANIPSATIESVFKGVESMSKGVEALSGMVDGVSKGVDALTRDIKGVTNGIEGLARGIDGVSKGVEGVDAKLSTMAEGITTVGEKATGIQSKVANVEEIIQDTDPKGVPESV